MARMMLSGAKDMCLLVKPEEQLKILGRDRA